MMPIVAIGAVILKQVSVVQVILIVISGIIAQLLRTHVRCVGR
jgi:hypothetical protein